MAQRKFLNTFTPYTNNNQNMKFIYFKIVLEDSNLYHYLNTEEIGSKRLPKITVQL